MPATTTTLDAPPTVDRVAELVETLHAGVAALVTGADWQRFLDVAARFHRYSFWNTVAILCQRPEATRVAGYGRWRSLGRQVRKGERGIRILAPVNHRAAAADTTGATADGDQVEQAPDEAAPARPVLRGFKVVSVFDVAQTDGDALPEPPTQILAGDAPDCLLDDVAALIQAQGLTFTLGPLPATRAGANGTTNFVTGEVIVRDDLPAAMQAKTAAHELGHVLLHRHGFRDLDRARAEVEAESVAYVLLGAHGVTTDAYSFGYLAGWSGGDVDVVRSTGERVMDCARRILYSLGLAGPDDRGP